MSLLALLLLCGGCLPLTQTYITRSQGEIRTSGSLGKPLLVSLRTPTLERSKQGEIDSRTSYARNAHGKRFQLQPEKTPYVESYPDPSYWLSRELRLVGGDGKELGWSNGTWQIHLELVSPRGREVYEADFALKTLIWTPFLGPPN